MRDEVSPAGGPPFLAMPSGQGGGAEPRSHGAPGGAEGLCPARG